MYNTRSRLPSIHLIFHHIFHQLIPRKNGKTPIHLGCGRRQARAAASGLVLLDVDALMQFALRGAQANAALAEGLCHWRMVHSCPRTCERREVSKKCVLDTVHY